MFYKPKGFTLIELLVVITIIGLLASVVLASFSNARMSARDAKRQTELRSIATALELYRVNYGSYPIGAAGSDRPCWRSNSLTDFTCHPLGRLVQAGYISAVPIDPGRNSYLSFGTLFGCGAAQFYAYWSNGNSYLLGAVQEASGLTGCTQVGSFSGPTATNYTYHYYIKVGL